MQRIELFDKKLYQHGYVDDIGNFKEDEDHITTEMTVVYPNNDIIFTNVPVNSYITFYSNKQRFIEQVKIQSNNKIQPPSEAAFIRITFPKDTPQSIYQNYNFWIEPYAAENGMCQFYKSPSTSNSQSVRLMEATVELRKHNLVMRNSIGHSATDYPVDLNLLEYNYYITQANRHKDTKVNLYTLFGASSLSKILVNFTVTSMRELDISIGTKTYKSSVTYGDFKEQERLKLQGTREFTIEIDPNVEELMPVIRVNQHKDTGYTLLINDISISFDKINKKRLPRIYPLEPTKLIENNGKLVNSGYSYNCSYIIECIQYYNLLVDNNTGTYYSGINKINFTSEYPTLNTEVIKQIDASSAEEYIHKIPKNAKYAVVQSGGKNLQTAYQNTTSEYPILSIIKQTSLLLEVEVYQEVESFALFRDDIYQWMKETLSPNLTKGDLDIIIKLMCYIFGDLTGLAEKLKDQIDVDRSDEYYLRHLCTLIGYDWNEALTAEQQKESIKLFIDLRKLRGTKWSIENLIKVFGQDATSYYSTSDLRGVRAIEYQPNDPETFEKDGLYSPDKNGLYPGDILLEVPQFSSILRFAIDNIRLIGTRIIFCYLIYCGIFKMHCQVDCGREIHQYFDPAYWGYDPLIKDFRPQEFLYVPGDKKKEWIVPHGVYKNLWHNPSIIGSASYWAGSQTFKNKVAPDSDGWYNLKDLTEQNWQICGSVTDQSSGRQDYSSTRNSQLVKFDQQSKDIILSGDKFKIIVCSKGLTQEHMDKLKFTYVINSNTGSMYNYTINGDILTQLSTLPSWTTSLRSINFTFTAKDKSITRQEFTSLVSQLSIKIIIVKYEGSKVPDAKEVLNNMYWEETKSAWLYTNHKQEPDGTLQQTEDWFITHRVKSAISHISCAIYIFHKEPYERGFIWKESGDDNYKGFLLEDGTLKDNDTMYD